MDILNECCIITLRGVGMLLHVPLALQLRYQTFFLSIWLFERFSSIMFTKFCLHGNVQDGKIINGVKKMTSSNLL